ncbi:hypothetical protein M3J09_002666 [Ascochyta lentis]
MAMMLVQISFPARDPGALSPTWRNHTMSRVRGSPAA